MGKIHKTKSKAADKILEQHFMLELHFLELINNSSSQNKANHYCEGGLEIKFCELLLRISPRIINSLRSYIKHWKECFLLFPNTSKLVKKTSAVPCFSNLLLSVWKLEETLFLVFDLLRKGQKFMQNV